MKLRWKIGGGSLLALLLVGVFALVAVRQPPALPNPNGYDRLVALAATIPKTVPELNVTNATAIAQFATDHSNLVTEVLAAVRLPALVPLKYSPADVNRLQSMMDLRRLEKALLVCAHHREDDGDIMAATSSRLATIELGQQGTRGGLLIHFMLGSAIQMNALTKLSKSVPHLDAAACQLALRGLARLRSSQEPMSGFAVRERRWMLIGSGRWQEWDMAKELPGALFKRTEPASFLAALNQAYDGTDSALRRRLAELEPAVPSRAAQ